MSDIAIKIEHLGKRYRYGGTAPFSQSLRADLADWLRAGYGVSSPEDLSLAEASRLIDELKAGAGA